MKFHDSSQANIYLEMLFQSFLWILMELKYTLDSRGDIPTYGFDHHGYTVIRNNSTTAGPTLADRAASLAASTLQSSKDRFASASSSQGKSGKKQMDEMPSFYILCICPKITKFSESSASRLNPPALR